MKTDTAKKPAAKAAAAASAFRSAKKKPAAKPQGGLGKIANESARTSQLKMYEKMANGAAAQGDNGVVQRITDKEHGKLYHPYSQPLGLRFQPGEGLPKETVKGDQYGLQDERYDPKNVDAEKYTFHLNQTVESAVGKMGGWFVSDNGMTLKETFDRVRSLGQVAIMKSPIRAWRQDYGTVFGSVGKQEIKPEDFMIRIPLINVWDYEKYKSRWGEKWQKSWYEEIWPDIVANIKTRVADAFTLALGGKLSPYNLGPSFDPDPETFLRELDELDI